MVAQANTVTHMHEETFIDVLYYRMKNLLSPQLDLYKNIADEIITPIVAHERPISVIDYGCGNGMGTVQLKKGDCSLFGVDRDPKVIEFANEVLGNIAKFSIEDWQQETKDSLEVCTFDIIVCIEVIEHLEYPKQLIVELKRRLKKGGVLVLSTLNHNSQYRKNHAHIGRFCVADFRKLMSEFFPYIRIVDYTLRTELDDNSTITPMIAIFEDTIN